MHASARIYNASTRQWVPAYMLKIGDKLLCARNVTKTVASIALVKEPLPIRSDLEKL